MAQSDALCPQPLGTIISHRHPAFDWINPIQRTLEGSRSFCLEQKLARPVQGEARFVFFDEFVEDHEIGLFHRRKLKPLGSPGNHNPVEDPGCQGRIRRKRAHADLGGERSH